MLQHLSISNYVLIENQEIDFQSGFSVLTGETGAGKSIILGALGLLMGNRADKEVVLEEGKKCIIEGHFNISQLHLKDLFQKHDLDYEEVSILRREITKAGKSRAFVNDSPVNLTLLKLLGSFLMDIHSQNQNQQLNNSDFRLSIIDAYADHDELLRAYKTDFKKYKEDLNALVQLKSNYQNQINEQEYHQFLFDEIEKLQLVSGEQKDIEEELKVLNHAEEIKSSLFSASSELVSSDDNIIQQLERIQGHLQKVSSYHQPISELENRLQSLIIELKDIGEESSLLDDQFQFDPNRLDLLNDRLQEIFSLIRKHRLNDADDLIHFKEELSEKIHSVLSLDSKISKQEELLNKLAASLMKQAGRLSKNRKSAVQKIEKLVMENLKNLGLAKAELKIDLLNLEELSMDGMDSTKFLFKANSGSKLSEMNKVASGGEMSRLMLSFKYVLALKKALPTIIFDEIDSGVSGEIADKLARLMEKLGHQIQVLAISHLPQIASRAQGHYLVYKENDSIFTRSKIKKLNQQERLKEIAAMLSGSKVGDSAIEHAKELLGTKS